MLWLVKSLISIYLLIKELCIAGNTFAFLREDSILSWQMYTQSKLQGHASYTSEDLRRGQMGHLAGKRCWTILWRR